MNNRPNVVWEKACCPLCGADREEVLLTVKPQEGGQDHRLVRCRECGMGYLDPRPDEKSIGCFYPIEYECYQAPQKKRESRWKRLRSRLERLVLSSDYDYPPRLEGRWEKLLAKLAAPWFGPGRDSMTAVPFRGEGRLLDYGCGSGWYAQRMRERGWTVTGMDFNARAAEQVARRFGFPVLSGTLPHPEVAPESFDVITMGAVLEHVHHPHALIEAAARALRPGGMLVISVPNLASWQFRQFGQDCWSLELPRHLLHFTPSTLRSLVESHGLEVEEIRTLGRTSWMRRSLGTARRRAEAEGNANRLVRIGHLPLVASLLTRWTAWTGQADCLLVKAVKPRAECRSTARVA